MYTVPLHKLTTWLPQQRSYLKVTWVVKTLIKLLFIPGHYFMDGQGQGRMAGTSTDIYKFNTVIRGHHIYKTVWTPLIDETLQVWKIPMNTMNMLYTAIMHC